MKNILPAFLGLQLLIGCGLGGCAQNVSDSTEGEQSDTPDDTSYPDSYCTYGGECLCDEYSPGILQCVDGVDTCDCSMCDSLNPTSETVPVFSACGGDPTGDWKLVEVDLHGVPFKLNVKSSTGVTSTTLCPAAVTWSDELPKNHLRLKSDKSAEVWRASAELTMRFQSSCTLDRCETLEGAANCQEDSCGLCQCETWLDGYSDQDAHWTTDLNGLVIYWGSGSPPAGDPYCISGDTLTTQLGGTEVWTFERVKVSADCLVSEWDIKSGCAATAVADAPVTACVDATSGPASCSDLTSTQCLTNPGCNKTGYCVGTPNSCSDYSIGCAYYGCTPGATQYASCTGNVTCSSLTDAVQCGGFGCDWIACEGTWEACSTLSEEACTQASHCELVIVQ